jgi:GAF domain-containing protein
MTHDAQSPLQRSLAELSTMLISDRSLRDMLTRVSALAVDSMAAAEFAGITMMVDGRVSTQAFTDPSSPEIDQAQYESGRGPCLDAFMESRIVVVDELAGDERWPQFAAAALRHGVHSTMSLPLSAGEAALGALNLYARISGAFGEADVAAGELFAAQAAVLLANAQSYWGARLKSEHLQLAMESRASIEMAKGIIMSSMGCGPDEAFEILVQQSQHENRKLREIAAEIVARAARRQQ